MPVFFPGNEDRADRLQQLIDDITALQTQAAIQSQTMDKADVSMRANLDALLQSKGMTTFDELEAEIIAELTPDQRDSLQNMIDFTKKFGDVTDSILQVSSLIFAASMVARLAITATAYSQTVGLMRVVKGFARGFELLNSEGFSVANDYFKGFRAGLDAAEIEFAEGSRIGKILGAVGEVCEFLGWAGVALDAIMLVIQAIEGAIQKDKLNEAIAQTQITRLSTAYFNNECVLMSAHIESLSDWMEMRASSDPDDQAGARALGNTIARRIAQDEATLTLAGVEATLEGQDAARGSDRDFDIPTADVIAGSQVDIANKNANPPPPLAAPSTPPASGAVTPPAPAPAAPITPPAGTAALPPSNPTTVNPPVVPVNPPVLNP